MHLQAGASLGRGDAGDGEQPRKAPRQCGGKATVATKRQARAPTGATAAGASAPTQHARMRAQIAAADARGKLWNGSQLQTNLEAADLEQGAMSAIERGLIPASFDLTDAMHGSGGGSSLISVAPAALHKHVDQFRRHEVMTSDIGFGSMLNVKLDVAELERAASPPPPLPPPPPAPPAVAPAPPVAVDASMEAKPQDRDDARTYAELLDVYSLHEFIIRRGTALRNTPEFTSFQRSYKLRWGAIEGIITALEKLLADFGVPLAYVDGKAVAQLAAADVGAPTRDELLRCIANRADVEPLLASVAQLFKQGARGHDAAATKIQSVVRMRIQRHRYVRLRAATLAAMLIQRQWGVHRGHMKTRRTLAVLTDALVAKWRQTMTSFAADWPRIQNSRRVIVHIPSLSYAQAQTGTVPYYHQMQRSQLGRLADLADDKVEILLVSPVKYESEALQYYYRLLQASGVRAPQTRVVVLVPENADRLPASMSLTKAVLCSPRLMRALSALVRGKTAYVVPSVVSNDELVLAAKLNLPMLGPDPRVALSSLSTKSGLKTLFESADVVAPVGAHSIKSAQDLYLTAARLIADYPEYPRWLVKLDAEFASRGHAYIEVRKLKVLDEGARRPEEIEVEDPVRLAARIHDELADGSGKRFKILNTHVYPDWSAFAKAIETMGCCIEAVPGLIDGSASANVLIEPNGTARLLSVQQQLHTAAYTAAGVQHPQQVAPFEAIRDAALSICAAAFRRKVMGYATIDFVVFRKADTGVRRMWAVDMDAHLTNASLAHSLAMLATNATYDHETGQCVVRSTTNNNNNSTSLPVAADVSTRGTSTAPLHYSYSGVLYHNYISELRHSAFFSLAAARRHSFDGETRTGVVFHLVDVLLCKCVGFLCIGASTAKAAAMLRDVVDFLQQQLSAANAVTDDALCNVAPLLEAARNNAHKLTEPGRRAAAAVAAAAGSGHAAASVIATRQQQPRQSPR